MSIESGKDYSFLLRAPGQLEELFKSYGVTTKHPVLRLPSAEWVVQTLRAPDGRQLLEKGLSDREQLIKLMEKDPFRYGYKQPSWKDLRRLLQQEKKKTVFITGPNRTGKTEGAADLVMEVLTSKPRAIVWCACETNETSIRGGGQQEVVWKYLPPEWKALNHKRTDQYSISYNPKNRFADNAFIAPNGSECRFMNYEQDIGVIEGGAIDLFWFDENCPVEWVVTAEGRLVDRRGNGLVTYTPVQGWNACYGLFAGGGSVRQWQEFPLFREMIHWPGGQPGQIPYILDSMDPNRAMLFMQPSSNPFVSWEALVQQWSSASYEVQMLRLAGLARKKVGNRFPKFNRAVHIVPASKVPAKGTNYHFSDYAWERNWYQFWVRVTRVGDKRRLFIYREWPDKKTYGEWAVPSKKPNGERGPAQTAVGLSITGYIELARVLEGWKGGKGEREKGGEETRNAERGTRNEDHTGEVIFRRLGDPRSGRAPAVTHDEGGTCILDMLTNGGMDPAPEPAKGLLIGEGVNLINELLDYREDQPLSVMNEPELFISEECEQLIDCMQLWTGQGSEKEQSSKDPIDLLRYMATEDLDDLPAMRLGSEGGGSY
jgi:hypothetical protein